MSLISDYRVVLVEPKYCGNIGAVARSMMNFDLYDLYLVNPCRVDEDARARAMHAVDILDNAKIFDTFGDSIKDLDYIVATSSIVGKSEKKHLRKYVSLREFAERVRDVDGKIGLVFGREDYGLFNEEIAQCDALVNIPTSDIYPSMNLSHAVAVVLYEVFSDKRMVESVRKISGLEKEKINKYFSEILNLIDYPPHKKKNTRIMFRRLLGRAIPSIFEYHTIMGVMSEIIKRLR